jgi:hypothetical protein
LDQKTDSNETTHLTLFSRDARGFIVDDASNSLRNNPSIRFGQTAAEGTLSSLYLSSRRNAGGSWLSDPAQIFAYLVRLPQSFAGTCTTKATRRINRKRKAQPECKPNFKAVLDGAEDVRSELGETILILSWRISPSMR